MKTHLRWGFTITVCALLMINIALPQDTLKQDSSATVTIVTAGDVSVIRAADGKTAVTVNFVPGKAKSGDTRITISGPYSLDVNGGVKEVKGPQGVELHVLSHEEMRFEASGNQFMGTITQVFSILCMQQDSQVFPDVAIQFVTNLTIRGTSAGITVVPAVPVWPQAAVHARRRRILRKSGSKTKTGVSDGRA